MPFETKDSSPTTLYLTDWRLFRNMTQRELAERSGVALTSINEIETGKRQPRPSTLRRLASALQTEDWNLSSPAHSSYGIVPEAARTIERLGKAAREISIQGNHGGRLADALDDLGEGWGGHTSQLQDWAEEALVLLIPFWLRLRQLDTAAAPRADAQQAALNLSGAMPWRIQELKSRGMPPDVAEALLRAEVRAITMGAADPNGGHDAILEKEDQ
jgi:transcriptional regulator with XRE-family HTH domain